MKHNIQRISSILLWSFLSISAVVALLFYIGGEVPEAQRLLFDYNQPTYTFLFVDWALLIFLVTLAITVFFSLYKWLRNFSIAPAKTVRGTAGVLLLLLLLILTFLAGSGHPLPIIGYTGKENVFFWLKLSDMWIYTICILFMIAALLVIGFETYHRIQRKRR
jgi:magnesium-transporting ATPase (P-type)